jgi:division protein CdvB (Snf7/Vps24/ESCRT-III family)
MKNLELRDRFAIAYLQGKIANGATSTPRFSDLAEDAYKMADEMMKARVNKSG